MHLYYLCINNTANRIFKYNKKLPKKYQPMAYLSIVIAEGRLNRYHDIYDIVNISIYTMFNL